MFLMDTAAVWKNEVENVNIPTEVWQKHQLACASKFWPTTTGWIDLLLAPQIGKQPFGNYCISVKELSLWWADPNCPLALLNFSRATIRIRAPVTVPGAGTRGAPEPRKTFWAPARFARRSSERFPGAGALLAPVAGLVFVVFVTIFLIFWFYCLTYFGSFYVDFASILSNYDHNCCFWSLWT